MTKKQRWIKKKLKKGKIRVIYTKVFDPPRITHYYYWSDEEFKDLDLNKMDWNKLFPILKAMFEERNITCKKIGNELHITFEKWKINF